MTDSQVWTTDKVRKTFIDFFVEKYDHTFVPSSPVIPPKSDKTLKFANAGMNQFKSIFLNTVNPNSKLATLKRAVNSQKCIRAGGKHNDLDTVGRDSYHHTFFEMLGSWSFGQYFKEEAIDMAWELLTEVYKLDPERLYVTYFGGDESKGLEPDNESRDFWKKHVPDFRIISSNYKDNFWEMGNTGPCGPCSEIHYDKVGGRNAADIVNQDDPYVIEIWNLVFMQYNREDENTLKTLPAQHVDTGMGLERLTAILQDKMSNYEIDIFSDIFSHMKEMDNSIPEYTNNYNEDDEHFLVDVAYRSIADHIRALSMAIVDGGRPASTDAGHVLRQICSRAIYYGQQYLHTKEGFFTSLVPSVIKTLGDHFTELNGQEELIEIILRQEEAKFTAKLNLGMKRFKRMTTNLNKGDVLPTVDVFLLKQSYGFPLDLTQRLCEDSGLKVLEDEFEEYNNKLKEASKKNEEKKQASLPALNIYALTKLSDDGVASTDYKLKYVEAPISGSKIVAIWDGTELIEEIPAINNNNDNDDDAQLYGLVLDKTNYYATQGGQIHDVGEIIFEKDGDDVVFDVIDVKIVKEYVCHIGTLQEPLNLKIGDECKYLVVDYSRRLPIKINHTATHLTNFGLKQIFGNQINQAGSHVDEQKFRFDFTVKDKPSTDQLKQLQNIVQDLIEKDLPVYSEEVSIEDALQINGLRKMDDEEYPDPVRVISIGVPIQDLLSNKSNPEWDNYSIEFCGGTHLDHLSLSKKFIILSQEPVKSAVRRVTCVTSQKALDVIEYSQGLKEQIDTLCSQSNFDSNNNNNDNNNNNNNKNKLDVKGINNILDQLSPLKEACNSSDLPLFDKIQYENTLKDLTKYLNQLKKSLASQNSNQTIDQIKDHFEQNPDSNFYVCVVENADKKTINDLLGDPNKKKKHGPIYKAIPNKSYFLIGTGNNKTNFVIATSVHVKSDSLKANEWVSHVCKACGGKGGGSPNGIKGLGTINPDQLDQAVKLANEFASNVFNN